MPTSRLPLRRALFAALVSIALAGCAGGAGGGKPGLFPRGTALPPPEDGAPAAEAAPAISAETLGRVTQALASDAFEGRQPGTAGEAKTLAYLSKAFADAGLVPGNQGSWFQDVPIVEITASGFSPLAFRRGGKTLSDAFGRDFVATSYRAVARTQLRSSELVFVGYGIVAPEKGWNDYAGFDMRGKTALILVNDPDYASEGLEGRSADGR